VLVAAPGCVLAAWWQATRALGGNVLSWVYSIEWPLIAGVALFTWWHLIHADPGPDSDTAPAPDPASLLDPAGGAIGLVVGQFPRDTTRRAARLAIAVGCELLAGIAALVLVPLGRPSAWLPSQGEVIYLIHAVFGAFIALGAGALVVHVKGAGRLPGIVAWLGLSGVLLACGGGLLTEVHSLVRLLGIAVMFVGTVCAGLSYMIPTFVRRHQQSSVVQRASAPTATGEAIG
jgi:hypothetical protein